MPLLPFARCDVPEPETPCDFLFDTGQAILDVALAGLGPYIPASDCDSFSSYVSLNRPVAEHYDALSVHLVDYGPFRNADQPLATIYRIQWRVELWENQYPGAERIDDNLVVPSPDTINDVNRHVYAHGMAVYNALMVGTANCGCGHQGGFDFPDQIGRTTLGPLVPLGPTGTAVGWAVTVFTEVG